MSDIIAKEALSGSLSPKGVLGGSFSTKKGLSGQLSADIVHNDYNELKNRPKLNSVTIEGDKTLADYGFAAITPQEIDQILFGE